MIVSIKLFTDINLVLNSLLNALIKGYNPKGSRMDDIELGQVYKVIKGAFSGSKGVLCSHFGSGCYFIKESNGDRVMVTASQIEKV